ncbi:hypothetical protein L1987_17637 [Smallanthus sonchifolius]|uniref:Uncharacterized protein n=1 Tax=Smallanthus sonchifolius TaxID=185202 RepID=A0ACB9IY20_9ASTR|nr:hypothetical protein L1987_17637 [Smallanthus sonchifolius]
MRRRQKNSRPEPSQGENIKLDSKKTSNSRSFPMAVGKHLVCVCTLSLSLSLSLSLCFLSLHPFHAL